jgi:hypothetical protein
VDVACTGCGIVGNIKFHGPLTVAAIRKVDASFDPKTKNPPSVQGSWNTGGHALSVADGTAPCPHLPTPMPIAVQYHLLGRGSASRETVTQKELIALFKVGNTFSGGKLKIVREPAWGGEVEQLPKGKSLTDFMKRSESKNT